MYVLKHSEDKQDSPYDIFHRSSSCSEEVKARERQLDTLLQPSFKCESLNSKGKPSGSILKANGNLSS